MPGDRFTFSIQVRREVDRIAVLGKSLQLAYDFFLAGQDLIARPPTIIRIDTHALYQLFALLARLITGLLVGRHFAGERRLSSALFWVGRGGAARSRQVSDVTDTGLHDEVLTKILVNRFGLGRRFHNYQCFTHKTYLPALLNRVQGQPARRKVGIYKGDFPRGQVHR